MVAPLSYEVPTPLSGPSALGLTLQIGDVVNVPLSGRNVDGWIVGFEEAAPPGVTLRPINRVVSVGPTSEIIDLCYWAARHWCGRPSTLLKSANPPRRIRQRIQPFKQHSQHTARAGQQHQVPLAADFWDHDGDVFVAEVAPTENIVAVVSSVMATARTLVLIPQVETANRMVRQLRTMGHTVARWPDEWPLARAGANVVGTRPAAFASIENLEAIVVIDEHDPLLQQESSPTWHARDVAVERGRRLGIPTMLLSPIPSLEARFISAGCDSGTADAQQHRLDLETVPTVRRRRGSTARQYWPEVQVIDRRGEDSSRTGLYSPRLVQMMRDTVAANERVLCILNRTGRSQLLICRSCQSMITCSDCGATVRLEDDEHLHCAACGATRPSICAECGATRLVQLRIGVSKAREELEVLLGVEVASLTAQGDISRTASDTRGKSGTTFRDPERYMAVVGTSAALARRSAYSLVAFLDFDQQLLSPGYRTSERAAAQLVAAARLLTATHKPTSHSAQDVLRKATHVRPVVAIQTRMPEHGVIEFIERSDTTPLAQTELERRQLLELPPVRNAAVVGGEASPQFIEQLQQQLGLEIRQRNDQAWMVQADSRDQLIDAISRVERGPGRLRLQIDPFEFPRWTQPAK